MRVLVLLAALVAPLVVTQRGHAEASEADKSSARKLLDEGRALLEQGAADKALGKFEAADAIVHAPSTVYYRALALQALGRWVEALEVARAAAVLPKGPEEATPSPFRARAAELADKLAPKIPRLHVRVLGADGADVSIDGRPVKLVQGAVAVDPGARRVEAVFAGRHARRDLTLREGEVAEIELDLRATTSTPAPLATPPPTVEPPPSRHVPARSSALSTSLTYGGFGLVVLGLAAGATFGGWAFADMTDAKRHCVAGRCDEGARGPLDDADRHATWSNVGFVGAGVGLVLGGLGLYLRAPSGLSVAPTPVGFHVVGRF